MRPEKKKSGENIGSGTRDLPACSAVPQPNAPPRVSTKFKCNYFNLEATEMFQIRVKGDRYAVFGVGCIRESALPDYSAMCRLSVQY